MVKIFIYLIILLSSIKAQSQVRSETIMHERTLADTMYKVGILKATVKLNKSTLQVDFIQMDSLNSTMKLHIDSCFRNKNNSELLEIVSHVDDIPLQFVFSTIERKMMITYRSELYVFFSGKGLKIKIKGSPPS